jgi:hypothetical protein
LKLALLAGKNITTQTPSNNTSSNISSNNSRTLKAQEICRFQHEATDSRVFSGIEL